MSNQIVYIMMGGSAGLFVLIILAYYILSKKMQKSEYKKIQKLQQGTKTNSFSTEVLFQKLYLFYRKIPFLKRYILKLRRKLEIINIQDEYATRRDSAKIITKSLVILLPIVILTILLTKTNYLDAEHIEWLKRYLQEYENAFILISHDIPFLNDVVNIIYHMENQELNRYVGNYDKFLEVYEARKAQQEAAYRKQQQEISELKDFVARNKARVATRNMAMSRQKKLDKMDVIELARERPKPEFYFKEARTPGKMLFETEDLVIGYDKQAPLSKPINLRMERGEKIAIVGTNGIGKSTLLKSLLGIIKPISGTVKEMHIPNQAIQRERLQ